MAGLEAAVATSPDLVVVDLGLPDVDGYEVLRMLRAVSAVPVIVATAREEECEIVRALDSGADDYLVKPFGAGQLDARIRAVLRRAAGDGGRDEPLVVGSLVVDSAARIARLDGRRLDLTPREFDLLRYLAERAGQVVTKRELLAEVWRQPYGGAEKTVDVHLSWLRRKLGETAQEPRYLQTVRGVGVRLTAPEAERDRGVRAQLGILVAATTSLVLLAFLVPLGLLLRRTAEERAISAATQQAQSVAALVSLSPDAPLAEVADGGARITVFFPTAGSSGRRPRVRRRSSWPPGARPSRPRPAAASRCSCRCRACPAAPRWCSRTSRSRCCTRASRARGSSWRCSAWACWRSGWSSPTGWAGAWSVR